LRAASRALWTAGKRSARRMPMMTITTSHSTRVNPRWKQGRCMAATHRVGDNSE
jgi:hypothetical protein